jgi:hypothetical protein
MGGACGMYREKRTVCGILVGKPEKKRQLGRQSQALGQVPLPVHKFSLVSIIPPLLHTHSFIYHTRCIKFLSQYFSFPLSVSIY